MLGNQPEDDGVHSAVALISVYPKYETTPEFAEKRRQFSEAVAAEVRRLSENHGADRAVEVLAESLTYIASITIDGVAEDQGTTRESILDGLTSVYIAARLDDK